MSTTFKFREYSSNIFGKIKRPVAEVEFQHQKDKSWQPITMLVDTGADYTILPKFLAPTLGVSITKDCKQVSTRGVGGKTAVYLLKKKIKIKLGEYTRNIPVGFIDSGSVPPLMGRQECLESFKVTFENFTTKFE